MASTSPTTRPSPARITVWMRTAARKDVVAFKTFLRTLIHELCHHLDYELYKMPETFHTEGFYKRESTLVTRSCARSRRRATSWVRIRSPPRGALQQDGAWLPPRPARLGEFTLATALVEPCPRTG